ncbi:MAG TPA: hypothetical protein VIX17_13835 [Pyrinomonadaceae bacterium]|jgi:hypothetical protein
MFIVGMIYDCALQRSGMSLSWVYIPLLTERAAADESPPINIVLLRSKKERETKPFFAKLMRWEA